MCYLLYVDGNKCPRLEDTPNGSVDMESQLAPLLLTHVMTTTSSREPQQGCVNLMEHGVERNPCAWDVGHNYTAEMKH